MQISHAKARSREGRNRLSQRDAGDTAGKMPALQQTRFAELVGFAVVSFIIQGSFMLMVLALTAFFVILDPMPFCFGCFCLVRPFMAVFTASLRFYPLCRFICFSKNIEQKLYSCNPL